MKTIIFTICILLTSITLSAQDSISGVWDMGKGNTKVEIKGSEGKIISSNKLEPGTLILKDIIANEDNWKGKLYSAKKKKWLDAELKAKGNQLIVTVDAGFITKTLKWSKESF